MSPEISTADLDTTCDGLFLLLDTAKHYGFTRDDAEIIEHIRECRDCFDRNAEHIEGL